MKSTLLFVLLLAVPVCGQAQAGGARRHRPAAAALAASSSRPGTANAPSRAAGQTLPIRRVVLYSNGVAYIERRGLVSGRAEINLSFKQSQVDDVLKSMVVLDLGEGRVGAVSYNSSAPPAARMADIPFSIGPETEEGARGGLAGVLSQLQGARVVVSTARGAAAGSVLTVEERRTQADPSKPPVRSHALVIAAEGGELMSFDLSEVRSVRLADEGTRRDIGEFAAATASARRRDAKTITVTSDGAGRREMLVSYTVAAPIWKTTYRVVLDSTGKPFFQGWAIVDNVSDEDWEGVELSLISGMPVSFVQPIQKPFYRYRPVVPIPEDLRLAPQTYEPDTGETNSGGHISGHVEDMNEAAVAGATVTVTNSEGQPVATLTTDAEGRFRTPLLGPGSYTVTAEAVGFKRASYTGVEVAPSRAAQLEITLEVGTVSEAVNVTAEITTVLDSSASSASLVPGGPAERRRDSNFIAEAIAGGRSGVETAAEGGEVGDLFEYQIAQPVTVRRDRSALIPILQTRMEGARVSVFNEAARRTRPMSGMLLKNTSPLTLEDGALTVIDGSAYAGESLLERLKPGEQRLVSFALDLGTLVTVRDEEDEEAGDGPVYMVRILNGYLEAHYHDRERKTYTLTNQTERPRTVYVEHPARGEWRLDDEATPKPEGRTARHYRFRVELGPRATERLSVVERRAAATTYALTNLTPDHLSLFVTRRYVDEATRAALQNIIDLKARLAAAEARAAAADKEAAEIGADQKRLRENIEALTNTAEARQLIARYVQKADQQETRLEQLTRDKQAAVEERQRLQAQLDAAIRDLALDRNPKLICGRKPARGL
ncbi:MAG TPA: carboxypeptidase-like regulatory domain-containing protein [Pyrinomonadaceae bacterium]|nr:carboxypeptidase-like regulatory domain-containing protein [Pyrinomonadaceae bacterium]